MKINRPKNSLSTSTGSFTIYLCLFDSIDGWCSLLLLAFRETAFPRQQYKRSNFLQQFGRSKICVFANRQKELSNPKVTMVNTCDRRFMLMKPDNLPRNKCYMFRKMGSSVKCGKKASGLKMNRKLTQISNFSMVLELVSLFLLNFNIFV